MLERGGVQSLGGELLCVAEVSGGDVFAGGGEEGVEVADVIAGEFLAGEALVAFGRELADTLDGGAGVEGEFELAHEVREEIRLGGEGGGGSAESLGGAVGARDGEGGLAGGGWGNEGPIGGRGTGQNSRVEIGEREGVGDEIEVGVGEGDALLTQGGAECGIDEEELAGVGNFRGRAGGEENGLLAIGHECGEVGGREDDGAAAGEKLGELGRETVVVEVAGLAGLHENVGEGEEAREFGFFNKAEVDDVAGELGGK